VLYHGIALVGKCIDLKGLIAAAADAGFNILMPVAS